MEKQVDLWSALMNFFFNKEVPADAQPPLSPVAQPQPREQEIDMRCCICGSVEGFTVVVVLSSEGGTDWEQTVWRAESLAGAKGWQELWVVGGGQCCPNCIDQMELAIIPGHGIELVPKAMIEKGQAFLVSDFKSPGNSVQE